jgi:YfiR/HmsC-like
LRTDATARIAAHRQSPFAAKRMWPMLLVVAVLSCTVLPMAETAAAGEKPSEYDVEAAYLFNFGKFVAWPASASSPHRPLTICVLGEDPFGSALDRIVAGEKIGGRAVVDKKISNADAAHACSILYVSSSEATRIDKILAALKDAPVLTVSDIPDFAQRGGIIQFVLRDNRVRFLVNLGPAQHEGLSLSSELLKVAVSVQRAEGGN